MRIELKDIKGGVLEQEYDCAAVDFPELVALQQENGAAYSDPVHFSLRFQRVGQLVEVDGHLEAQATMHCGRCLQAFKVQVSESFSLTFTPQKEEGDPAEEMELASEELGLIIYQGDAIDLFAPLQEQLIMALPISPLCHEECRGLCPICGQDLNQRDCQCEKKVFNNKFTALAGLKLDKD